MATYREQKNAIISENGYMIEKLGNLRILLRECLFTFFLDFEISNILKVFKIS